jgi:adenine phosphoribosyltransferase
MRSDAYNIKQLIRPVENFPKPGVTFRDISTLLQSPQAFRLVCDTLVQRYVASNITHIGAMDARGFLLGAVIAYSLNKPLVLFRKSGKLPAEVIGETYQTEYGQGTLEIQRDSLCEGDCLLLVDDLIATGGTLMAAARLVHRLGARIHEAAVIIDLPELGGSKLLEEVGISTFSLTTYALDEK